MEKTHIIIHHSGVSIKDNNKQFYAIDNYHKSLGWGMIGYHYLIEPNGEIIEGRNHSQEGAHCYQNDMNKLSFGVCLAGNFDIENPTRKQLISLKKLLKDLKKEYNIKNENIRRHTDYANYKTCCGVKLSKILIQGLLDDKKNYDISEWAKEAVNFCKKNNIAKNWTNPHSPVNKEDIAVMIYNFYNNVVKKNTN